ncbi:MAG: multicopper oxidase domain-containing protein [Desulfofustis sp.]|jgi:FtsP/CotA-like multicopper oxidase with cupredoxin domain|nr:multicopper oxidase domain-containing protein [Desulfofustis sp.]
MKHIQGLAIVLLALVLLWAGPAAAATSFQCPNNYVPRGNRTPFDAFDDANGDGMLRADEGEISNALSPNQVCMHLSGGDGFGRMADGYDQYLFGFANLTGIPNNQIMAAGALAAEWPAPTIELKEGDEFYLTLSNVGMQIRPDLFDPHTVHYHGLPHSTNIYDGLPESGIAINMGSSLTYFYYNAEPGTYIYHCHVEATEHMQMGMLGNLYVKPAQDGTSITYQGRTFSRFAYNDGDGSTGYDVAYPLQLGGFDKEFHDASLNVAPLPFAAMWDDYPMINGRGYPDTVSTADLPASSLNPTGKISQKVDSLVTAAPGQRILLRISNLNVTRFHTLASTIPMTVVAKDAKLLRSASGDNLYYTTNSVTVGGGETYDVIIDTAGYAGTHFLYAANLNLLSNNEQAYGGMMTEIRIQ